MLLKQVLVGVMPSKLCSICENKHKIFQGLSVIITNTNVSATLLNASLYVYQTLKRS